MQSDVIQVTSLHIYPVKSLAGLDCRKYFIGPRGPEYDRHWMVTDADGKFLTQRELPRMALIRPEVKYGAGHGSDSVARVARGLQLTAPEQGRVEISISDGSKALSKVQVWSDTCDALDEGDEVAAWLSTFLGRTVRLVRMSNSFHRLLPEKYGVTDSEVGFADMAPLLLISEGSLELLNSKLPEPLRMDRFRTNIVVSGTLPHAEDAWKRIRIGEVEIKVIKACTRCPITTVNQQTAEKGPEPLRTLASYRRNENNKIIFGQNLAHLNTGWIRVGDRVEVLE